MLARTFDQMPKREAVQPRAELRRQARRVDGARPGDVYNSEMSWAEVLESHDWQHVYDRGEVAYWRRPGKVGGGISATTNYGGSDLLKVFTSSSQFDTEASYSKFAAYTVLEHGGDFTSAATALSASGYGGGVEPGDSEIPGFFLPSDRSWERLPISRSSWRSRIME